MVVLIGNSFMILVHILIGAIGTFLFINASLLARRHGIKLKVIHRVAIIAEILLLLFLMELIVGFIEEGAYRGALVLGSIVSLFAIIGALLIRRVVFNPKKKF